MDAGSTPGGRDLMQRVKAIIWSPREEWPRIAAEPRSSREIFVGYVVPLALVWPLATFIGGQIFGYGSIITYRPSLMGAASTALAWFLTTLVGVLVLTLAVEHLAPLLGGARNRANAFKLVAYGSTAGLFAGIFGLVPSLGLFSLLGLYSFFLYYTGAPLLGIPRDRAIVFAAVVALLAVIVVYVADGLSAQARQPFGGPAGSAEAGATMNLPGDPGAAIGMLDDAERNSTPLSAATLQELLPAEIGFYKRTETNSGAVGSVGSTAEGRYESGEHRINLKIVDMAALGGAAGLGAAMDVEQNREDADSYERTGSVGGQMRIEEWNRTTGSGRYAVVVGDRLLVEAIGNAPTIEDLKSAVFAIDQEELEDLVD